MNRCVGCGDPTPNDYPHVVLDERVGCCRNCTEKANLYADVLKATVERAVGPVELTQELLAVLERAYPQLLHGLGFLNDEEFASLGKPGTWLQRDLLESARAARPASEGRDA